MTVTRRAASGPPSPVLDRFRGTGRAARWRRTRLRRAGAVLLTLVAVWSFWGLVRPAEHATVPVLVAARPIAAGARITAADLKVVRWPSGATVPGLLTASTATGRTALAPIATGEPISTSRAGRSNWAALGPDEQAFTVPLADPALAALLSPGDRVDLYDPGDRRLVLRGARVVMCTTPAGDSGPSAGPGERLLVVAVPQRNSAELAGSLSTAATLGTGLVAAARPAA